MRVDASQQLMSAGYSLTANYGEIYNSTDLSSSKEIIFYRNYEKDVQMHSTLDYTGLPLSRAVSQKMQSTLFCSVTANLLLLRLWTRMTDQC